MSSGGFHVVAVDELPEPVVTTASLTSRVYDAKSGAYAETQVSVAAVNIRWQSSFAYQTENSMKYQSGDAQVIIAKGSTAPKAGDRVVVASHDFKIVSVFDQSLDDCWRLHLRHV